MSAHAPTGHGHAHGNDHGHDHGHEAPHGSLRSYVIGFAASVVLTVIPFWLVMGNVLSSNLTTALVVMAFGAVQIIVHMVYFLHMNGKAEGGWTLMALIFTVIIVVIALVGSLWVMTHLDTNMMPMSPEHAKNLP